MYIQYIHHSCIILHHPFSSSASSHSSLPFRDNNCLFDSTQQIQYKVFLPFLTNHQVHLSCVLFFFLLNSSLWRLFQLAHKGFPQPLKWLQLFYIWWNIMYLTSPNNGCLIDSIIWTVGITLDLYHCINIERILDRFSELYSIPLCGCIMMVWPTSNCSIFGRVSYFLLLDKTLMSSLSRI